MSQLSFHSFARGLPYKYALYRQKLAARAKNSSAPRLSKCSANSIIASALPPAHLWASSTNLRFPQKSPSGTLIYLGCPSRLIPFRRSSCSNEAFCPSMSISSLGQAWNICPSSASSPHLKSTSSSRGQPQKAFSLMLLTEEGTVTRFTSVSKKALHSILCNPSGSITSSSFEVLKKAPSNSVFTCGGTVKDTSGFPEG